MKKLLFLLLIIPSLCFAGQGMCPGMGQAGYTVSSCPLQDSLGQTPDDSHEVGDSTIDAYYAFPLPAGSSYTLAQVIMSARGTGTPGTTTVYLCDSISGVPLCSGGAFPYTLGTFNAGSINTSAFTNFTVTFGSPVALTSGHLYYLVFNLPYNSGNYFALEIQSAVGSASAGLWHSTALSGWTNDAYQYQGKIKTYSGTCP